MNWSLSARTWSEMEKMSVASWGGWGGGIMGKGQRRLVVQTGRERRKEREEEGGGWVLEEDEGQALREPSRFESRLAVEHGREKHRRLTRGSPQPRTRDASSDSSRHRVIAHYCLRISTRRSRRPPYQQLR